MSGANPVRECSRCGTLHTRKHTYCRPCYREWKREWPDTTNCVPGTPPPPPPGFDVRDMNTGRPLL